MIGKEKRKENNQQSRKHGAKSRIIGTDVSKKKNQVVEGKKRKKVVTIRTNKVLVIS